MFLIHLPASRTSGASVLHGIIFTTIPTFARFAKIIPAVGLTVNKGAVLQNMQCLSLMLWKLSKHSMQSTPVNALQALHVLALSKGVSNPLSSCINSNILHVFALNCDQVEPHSVMVINKWRLHSPAYLATHFQQFAKRAIRLNSAILVHE